MTLTRPTRAAAVVEWTITQFEVSHLDLLNPSAGFSRPTDYTYRYIIDTNGVMWKKAIHWAQREFGRSGSYPNFTRWELVRTKITEDPLSYAEKCIARMSGIRVDSAPHRVEP